MSTGIRTPSCVTLPTYILELMNVTLIGMSGVGKSYIGEKLASHFGYAFIDIDRILENKSGKSVQDILESLGEERFLLEEENEILKLSSLTNTVISPGGSVVYSDNAVKRIKELSKVVYLEAPANLIKERIDPSNRGIIGLKDRSFDEVYNERRAMYEKVADYTVSIEGKLPDAIVMEIADILELR